MEKKACGKSKGQIFTLDAFLSFLLVTVAVGLIATQTSQILNMPSNEIQQLSSDFAQIAVKRTLAVNEPNNLSSSKMPELGNLMNSIFQGTAYEYEAELYNSTDTLVIKKNQGCSSFKKVAVTQKPAIVDNQEGYFKMKICKE